MIKSSVNGFVTDQFTNRKFVVHQNKDKSLDIRIEFNGDFEDSVSVYVEKEIA